ncbi:MAG: 4-hydroxy-tetrahydrodipicolinate reductase [bacterium]
MIRAGLVGASGRMGTAIREVAYEFSGFRIDKTFEKGDHLDLSATAHLDVIVDFSTPTVTIDYAKACAAHGVPFVSGTTGLSPAQVEELTELSGHVAILHAANFSVGVNILEHLVELASAASHGFDIEIFEAHHRRKVDAPSGTALFLGRAAAKGRGLDLEEVARTERSGQRTDEEIGFQVLRGGGIVGEHTVYFVAEGERIELTHRAQERAIFARGAVRAALWLAGRPSGQYTMKDVLFA